MLETQEDVDIDGMERCKGLCYLCKYTFRQDEGVGYVQLVCLPANYSSLFSAVLAQVNGCHNFSNAS
ncbi:hypothetical protein NC653_008142 [Populus alba x Populus x berolinensis]|uniref:Uncharacterized protein n=1 Tax=Populus alba x Populus x berolinensis TaxID=444605 RepID=A0AAD6R616_9ROSI|nr:hypothetical protein NC653_008142 [Populus alba x Populus x berolinensis]